MQAKVRTMNEIKMLVVDLNSMGNMGSILRKTLGSAPELKVKFLRRAFNEEIRYRFEVNFSTWLQDFRPDLVLLLLSGRHLRESAELIEQTGKKSLEVPITAFFEDEATSDVLCVMLRTGQIFLLPGPLMAFNILPLVVSSISAVSRMDVPSHLFRVELRSRPMIGRSVNFLKEMYKIPQIARSSSCVLVSGESGTGKELCAQKIHSLSPRWSHPFFPVNCGAIPLNLVDRELFGEDAVGFSGIASRPGLIRSAEGSTIFLDEIDSLPNSTQLKLLRLLQENKYRPCGSTRDYTADVRLIAATSFDEQSAVKSGRLREDLYECLNSLSLKVPPLRERREDVPILAHYFLRRYENELHKEGLTFSRGAMHKLLFYDWPGNVRELEHAIERAVVLCTQNIIGGKDISLFYIDNHEKAGGSLKEAKEKFIEKFESDYIEKLLLAHNGNVSEAAQVAQKPRRVFMQLIRKYGIDVQRFQ